MTQQDFELLPCPFCGKQADLLDVGLRPDIGYIVRCTECDGQVGDTDEGWIQAGDAIKAWNKRAARDERVEFLERQLNIAYQRISELEGEPNEEGY